MIDGFTRRQMLAIGGSAAAAALLPKNLFAGWPVQSSYAIREPGGALIRKPGKAMSLYQRAVIIHDGTTERMVLKSLYTGEGDLFGCFGPVGADTRSRPIDDRLFTRLDSAVQRPAFASLGRAAMRMTPPRHQLFNLELLRKMDELRLWFDRNGFEMSPQERALFQEYLDAKRIFFAGLLEYRGYKPGTTVSLWTPTVDNAFSNDRVWYPIRSTTAGDGTHSFISLDVLTRGPLGTLRDYYTVTHRGRTTLDGRSYRVTRIEARLTMEQMQQDLEIDVG